MVYLRKNERGVENGKMSSIIRREFKKGDDIRDAGLTAPDDVIRYKDIAYGKDSAMQVLDVYRPKDTEEICR